MFTRLLLLALGAVCITMNVLVWRAEYSARANDFPVPEAVVWRKIMTAPEASSLNVYQSGKRTGFCEFSTSVEQEMAQMDENRPPPEGFIQHAGYQLRINGNASMGDFTNRVKFDGHLQFAPNRSWRGLDLHVFMHGVSVVIDSLATNQTVAISITSEGVTVQRTLTFAELQDPNRLLHSFADDVGGDFGGLLASLEFPALSAAGSNPAGGIHWEASRSRIFFGREPVPVYRLETRVLDHPVVIIASTLGEILRVEIPGDTVATLDEWTRE
jgi:hypothetical protein